MNTTLPVAAFHLAALAAAAVAAPPSWTAYSTGPNAEVNTLLVGDLGQGPRLFFAGEFAAGNGIPGSRVAAWNGAAFDLIPSLNSEVLALTVYPFGGVPQLCAGGFVGLVGANPTGTDGSNLVRLTPAGWQAVIPVVQIPWIGGLATYTPPGGTPRLIASGGSATYIAQFDGAAWSSMGAGLITVADSMVTADYNGQHVLLASAGAPTQTSLGMGAMWNGAQWTNYATISGGINGVVNAVAVFDDGGGAGPTLFVGGTFNGFTGSPLNRIAKLVGSTWQSVGGGIAGNANTANVNAMAVYDDGDGLGPTLFIAGVFATASGQPAANIAKLRSGQWVPLGQGVSGGGITSLAVFDDDGPGPHPAGLYAAGSFTSAGGLPTARWARWGRPLCAADIASVGGGAAADSQVTVDDLIFYLQSFFAANLAIADIASLGGAATADGQLTVDDLVAYLAAFFSGCP